jgi:hypothetical protein
MFTKPKMWISALAICALALSTMAVPSAESATFCPSGFETKDPFETPVYCDKLVEQTSSFTVPEGVTSISVMAFGGGGGGGGGGATMNIPKAGGGGGAGEITQASLTVVSGEVLAITIGTGGSKGVNESTAGLNGGDGGSTTLKNAANEVLVSAVGGKGGKSGTNGGDGGDSGNSTLADVNPGGEGFNAGGRSAGGGGGGFFAPGANGAVLNGGDGGQGGSLTGLHGFPLTQNNQMSWESIFPEYPEIKNLYNGALGRGGGGGVVGMIVDDTFDESAPGETHTSLSVSGGAGANHIYGPLGGSDYLAWPGTANNAQAQAFPGQGGSGGAGVRVGFSDDDGSDGVPGAVWLRVVAFEGDDDGGGGDDDGGGGETYPTSLLASSENLPYGGSIDITNDVSGSALVAMWVDNLPIGAGPLEYPWSFTYEYFSGNSYTSCEGGEVVQFALIPFEYEFEPDVPFPGLEETDWPFVEFTLGANTNLCGSGGGDVIMTRTNYFVVEGFSKGKADLTNPMKAFIQKELAVSVFPAKVVCTGTVRGKKWTASRDALALARATSGCDFVTKLYPVVEIELKKRLIKKKKQNPLTVRISVFNARTIDVL